MISCSDKMLTITDCPNFINVSLQESKHVTWISTTNKWNNNNNNNTIVKVKICQSSNYFCLTNIYFCLKNWQYRVLLQVLQLLEPLRVLQLLELFPKKKLFPKKIQILILFFCFYKKNL